MEQEFFLEELASLMNVPVYRYNCRTKEIRSFRKEGMDSVPEKEAAGEFGQELLLQPVPYPLIRLKQSDKNVIYIQVRDPKEAEAWYLIGPVFPGAAGEARRLNRLISGGLLLYWYLTGQHMDTVEFWNCNEKIFCDTHKVWEQVEQDIFEQQEQYGPHNPYEQELRELESIRTGDVEELNRSIAEVYEGRLGILAREPLRHHQNIAIGNITMASRAAIRGGGQYGAGFFHGGQFYPADRGSGQHTGSDCPETGSAAGVCPGGPSGAKIGWGVRACPESSDRGRQGLHLFPPA